MAKSYQKPIVLQVLPSLVSGGVERCTIDTTKFLKEAGYKSFVASSGGPLVKNVEKNDIIDEFMLHILQISAVENLTSPLLIKSFPYFHFSLLGSSLAS